MIIKEGTYENKTIGYYNHKYFIRVFYHDFKISHYFENASEAISCDLPGKYSILNELNSSIYDIHGLRYFIIRYPGLSNYGIYFSQLNNPLDEVEDHSHPALGFNFIFSETPKTNLNMSGLTRSTYGSSLLDGQPNGWTWYYAIGMYYCTNCQNGIPCGINGNHNTDCVELWAQININLYIKDVTICNCLVYNYFLSYMLITSMLPIIFLEK